MGAVQEHRPVCRDRSSFQYLAGSYKCSGMDCGRSCRPFDYSPTVTIRPMSEMGMLRQLTSTVASRTRLGGSRTPLHRDDGRVARINRCQQWPAPSIFDRQAVLSKGSCTGWVYTVRPLLALTTGAWPQCRKKKTLETKTLLMGMTSGSPPHSAWTRAIPRTP